MNVKRVRILCRIRSGAQVRPLWREEGYNYHAGVWRWKTTHAKNLATNASGPEGGVAGTIICHLQWASLICSHGVWLQPPVTVPLQIKPKRIHLASTRWEIGKNAGSPDILASSYYIIGPEKTEPSRQIFILFFLSELLISSLSRNWPTFLNEGALLEPEQCTLLCIKF